jgi:tetratricopeptide (TPR) repeat protein
MAGQRRSAQRSGPHPPAGSAVFRGRRLFARAIEIDPRLAIAHYNKAIAFAEQGRFGEAATCLRETVALRPELAEAHVKLGFLLNTDGHVRAAIDCFSRAAALKPSSAFALMCEARCLELDSEPAAAEEAVRRAIALDPQNFDAAGTVRRSGRIFRSGDRREQTAGRRLWRSGS